MRDIVIKTCGRVMIGSRIHCTEFPKVATVIRVRVRRSVIRIHIRRTVVSAIVPIAPKADRTNGVRIDKVSIAPAVPFYFVYQLLRGLPPPLAPQFTPYCAKQRSPPQFAYAYEGAAYAYTNDGPS